MLLNFNAWAFARRARAALKLGDQSVHDDSCDDDLSDLLTIALPRIERLNRVVGGDWWQGLIRQQNDFPVEVARIMSGACDQLRARFNEVCYHAVKEHSTSSVPKYYLVFASRSPDAFMLMNDAAVKSRALLLEQEATPQATLFETRPTAIVPCERRLRDVVIERSSQRMDRRHLVLAVMREAFGDYSESAIKKCIGSLLKDGTLVSSTGKSRIKDAVFVWRRRNQQV